MNILKLIMIISILISSRLYSYEGLKGCGHYEISGIVRKDKVKGLVFLVNERSKSEYKLTIASGEMGKYVGFINRPLKLESEISKINGTNAVLSNSKNLKAAIPNPLNPIENTGFKLIKESECF
jgi:hypothetical protein